MTPKKIFFSFLLILFLLSSNASCVPLRFSDINLNSRQISIYQVSASGSELVYHGQSDNSTFDLDPAYSYQIVTEPSRLTWLDDPRNAFRYFVDDAAGQTISFLVFVMVFIGLVRMIFK